MPRACSPCLCTSNCWSTSSGLCHICEFCNNGGKHEEGSHLCKHKHTFRHTCTYTCLLGWSVLSQSSVKWLLTVPVGWFELWAEWFASRVSVWYHTGPLSQSLSPAAWCSSFPSPVQGTECVCLHIVHFVYLLVITMASQKLCLHWTKFNMAQHELAWHQCLVAAFTLQYRK